MKQDTFFTQSNCDRCGGDLKLRIMSWFNDETICMECSDSERGLKEIVKIAGLGSEYFEGCGRLPKVSDLTEAMCPGAVGKLSVDREVNCL